MSCKVHEFDANKRNPKEKLDEIHENIVFIDDPEDDDCFDEDLLSEESLSADPFFQAMSLSQEDKDAYIDSGAFHAAIEGYLILAMQKKNYPADEIKTVAKELRDNILKTCTAKSARNAANTLASDAEKKDPAGNNVFKIKNDFGI